MSDLIAIKIDVTKIDKARLYQGKKGKYLDAILIPTPDSQYDQDFMVCQSISKEEREAGKKGPIIGNAKYVATSGTQKRGFNNARQATESPPSEPQQDDVPF